MPTSMRASCFSRANGCSTSWRVAELFLANVDADVVLAGRHDSSAFEPPVDLVGRFPEHLGRHLVLGAAETRQREPRAVEAHFEVVRRLGAAHDVDGVAPQTRLDHVFPVDGKVWLTTCRRACRVVARRRDRACERSGGRDRWRLPARCRYRPSAALVIFHAAEGTDPSATGRCRARRRCCRSRKPAVVRQIRRRVDLEREQIANRVAVLRAVQAMQRLSSRIRARPRPRGRAVPEISDELVRHLAAGSGSRPAASCGRAACERLSSQISACAPTSVTRALSVSSAAALGVVRGDRRSARSMTPSAVAGPLFDARLASGRGQGKGEGECAHTLEPTGKQLPKV